MLLSNVLDEYVLELQVKNYSNNTVNLMKHNIKQFIKFVGNISLEEINKVDIKKFIVEQQNHVKSNTVNSRLKNLRSFFVYCTDSEQGYLNENPMAGVSLLMETKTVMKTYSVKNVKALLNSMKGKDFLTVRNKKGAIPNRFAPDLYSFLIEISCWILYLMIC
ncbi:hypothetical protein ABE28_011185 [Peribacillus muralis]|uniref:Core-binding (CB) domain-containing protein n=2 Tax=Peribacillus muralis TaxID=264697 RepID=A0A1B3XNX5_9BACI|nr:hypothetical protein ABE28_011185 [Peribacillus muralis]